jgi:hypothetical protein
MQDSSVLFAFQVSGALPIGTRPLSRRLTTLIGLAFEHLPENLKSFECRNNGQEGKE